MFSAGICPKCEKPVSSVKAESISAVVGLETWKAVSYCCLSCNTVLSVQIDPIAIKTDILKALGK